MTQTFAPQALLDREVYDKAGQKIGKTETVILEERTRQPAFLSVSSGFLGMSDSIVPLAGAAMDGDRITVAYDKSKVKDAPSLGSQDELSSAEEHEILSYYGMAAFDGDTTRAPARGKATSDDAMTRSEERLHVGKEKAHTGTVRLRKYLVTEDVQKTVPVTHEEVRVEREPITPANRDAAMSGERLKEDEHEVTLHAEKPVVEKETVPVERVRLDKDTVTDQVRVDEKVQKERIEEQRS